MENIGGGESGVMYCKLTEAEKVECNYLSSLNYACEITSTTVVAWLQFLSLLDQLVCPLVPKSNMTKSH